MKIVLLGASGQLGREWQLVTAEDNRLVIFPYTSSQLDIIRHEEVRKELQKQQPEIVVNCAAFTDVDGAEVKRDVAHNINVKAVSQLASLSNELGFTLIHYSTDYVFPGNKEDKDRFPEGYPEDHPANPINYYGHTKWEGEQAIRRQTDDFLIMRVSWLCGRFGRNFVKTMLNLGRKREVLQVVNDQWGSPTFATDVVANSLNLIRSDQKGTFHLTTHGLVSWYNFANSIFKQSGIEVTVNPVTSDAFPTKAKRPHFSKLRTKKIEAISGTRIPTWEEGLCDLLKQLKKE